MNRYLNGKTLDEVAIERLQEFEAAALAKHPDGFYLAFSGGKDSVVILDLAKRAGVRFTAHHHLTTVDPPELVYFVRTFPEVQIHRPAKTMWELIRENGMPPLRMARYCCRELKEVGGEGRVVVTGVRWSESARRSKRMMSEACMRGKGRHLLHPIIDWKTGDVWQYIRERGLSYCSLYDEGFDRLGCVLCPMGTNQDVAKHLARWPKLCAAWERSIKRWASRHMDPEKRWLEWLDRSHKDRSVNDDPVLFEDDPELRG